MRVPQMKVPQMKVPQVRVPHPATLHRMWRSPIRGPWLTSLFGSVLLVGIPIEFITGLFDWAAYNPRLHGNDSTPHHGVLGFYLFDWFTGPSWLFHLSQGIHVVGGLVLTPILLAKLWSVIPRLFGWPPLRSVVHLLERASLLLLVGGAIFEFVTGIMNIDYDYSFRFSFYDGHFFGAWIFITGFTLHAILKMPTMWRSLRSRSLRQVLRTDLAGTLPEVRPPGEDPAESLVPSDPAEPTISRRGVLALVGGSSLVVFLVTAGQTIGTLKPLALLSPRTQSYPAGPDRGPNDFQVNRTAAGARIRPSDIGPSWQLRLVAGATGRAIQLSRTDLLALPLDTHDLPIACVEGWSVTRRWTGVRLARLAGLVGVDHPTGAEIRSLDSGPFGRVQLSGHQVRADLTLLALMVNGADLSPDHGYPARMVIPSAPGVHNTKWVTEIKFFGGPAA